MAVKMRNDTRGTEEANALLAVAATVASDATGDHEHPLFTVISVAVQAVARSVMRATAESLGVGVEDVPTPIRAELAHQIMRGLSLGIAGSQAALDPLGMSDEPLIEGIAGDIRHETPRLRKIMFAHMAKEGGGLH